MTNVAWPESCMVSQQPEKPDAKKSETPARQVRSSHWLCPSPCANHRTRDGRRSKLTSELIFSSMKYAHLRAEPNHISMRCISAPGLARPAFRHPPP